jgi:hypothetical protein
MKSHLTKGFRVCFEKLPDRIKRTARKNYKIWKKNSLHPSLDFKRVGNKYDAYSVRVGIGWRTLGIKENETIIWFWIGSHSDYDKLIKLL